MDRVCEQCTQTDDHPRHVVINSLVDDSLNTSLHLDCCNCEDHCLPLLAEAGGWKGDALREFLVNR